MKIPLTRILRRMMEESQNSRLFVAIACSFVIPAIIFHVVVKVRGKKENSKTESILREKKLREQNFTFKSEPECVPESVIYMTGEEVQNLVASGQFSHHQYLTFLSKRARTIGGQMLNAVTEECFQEAHDSVQKITNVNGKTNSLRGLPISIKDCIQQRGFDATCGSAVRLGQPFATDGLVVATLRNWGLIPFVRTNVPQLLMMAETENYVFGQTKNPWDLSRTPGGSSGGEAALVASGCSVLGLGSDIGGSIRIPAHFTGVVGFKPTPQRVTRSGSVVPRLHGRSGAWASHYPCP